jgi:ATP-dependent Clp protease ATP-binding subunit ClpA
LHFLKLNVILILKNAKNINIKLNFMKKFDETIFDLINLQESNINEEITLDNESYEPALELYGTDLTRLAKEGNLEPCFGRENELIEIMEILARRYKNNPILIGEPGVGKNAIIRLFATKIANNLVPFILQGRSVISLDLTRIISSSRFKGEQENRFQDLIDEIIQQPNLIIFLDDIHFLASGSNSMESISEIASLLKSTLLRIGFTCIGATTTKDYQIFEKESALSRSFQPVYIKESTIEQTIEILHYIRPVLESYHNIEISSNAIRTAVNLSSRYIQDRYLPEKAIDLIDRVAAREVIKLTDLNSTSLVSAIINTSLTQISQLRFEAFRRGDIASEFIFKEIETAYQKFLFTWLQNPVKILEAQPKTLSPISSNLYQKMRLTVISKVDELLFSSKIPKISQSISKLGIHFSFQINKNLYLKLLNNFIKNIKQDLSCYRISVFLFKKWINFNLKTNKKFIFQQIAHQLNFYNYLINNYKNLIPLKKFNSDFLKTDFKIIKYKTLSILEENQLKIFKDFLKNLKPILRKGFLESFNKKSNLNLSKKELKIIYDLLGYYSTNKGQNILIESFNNKILTKNSNISNFKKIITENEISSLISELVGIPVQSLTSEESVRLLELETSLHERVIGQEEAISAIAKAIRRSRLGLQNPNRPIASFLFCGPTGVGKTEITKTLAASMFGSENEMIRLDMSEFMEKFTISRLIGSPPGYIGYEDGGQLTDAVRKKPYSVVLFDELEKAHPDVLNILLQILEDGRLTDSQKRVVSFENTIIIMTSNAAAEEIQQIIKAQRNEDIKTDSSLNKINEEKLSSSFESTKFFDSPIKENYLSDIKKYIKQSFNSSIRNTKKITTKYLNQLSEEENKTSNEIEKYETDDLKNKLKNVVISRLGTIFLPEFLNRLDDIIIFQPLKPEELRKICDIMVKQLIKRVSKKEIHLIVDENVKIKMAREGYNPSFGARPLRRLVTKYLEDAISDFLLKNPLKNNKITLKIILNEENKIVVEKI